MRIRLYMDEDSMREALVRALRARGVDVVTAFDEHMMHRDDAEHLDYATKQGRVLVTSNVADFYELHTSTLTSLKRRVRSARFSAFREAEGLKPSLRTMQLK